MRKNNIEKVGWKNQRTGQMYRTRLDDQTNILYTKQSDKDDNRGKSS